MGMAWLRNRGQTLRRGRWGHADSVPLASPVRVEFGDVQTPKASVVPANVSGFSANRPVMARDDLFGRQAELDRVLAWVIEQRGSALVYGPRGYGKTSLARVIGEIADSRGHVAVYASCSRRADFTGLIKLYLREVPGLGECVADAESLSVQQVADMIAGLDGLSLLFILDEFDRIENEETRESLIELIKDSADLNAPVQFLLVGVATDAADILGYHPSVNRCLSFVPLTRLDDAAIGDLFRGKAAADGLTIPPPLLETIVRLSAGSPYHAQLIGQKMVGHARRAAELVASPPLLAEALREIIVDGLRIDKSLDAMSREFAANAGARDALMKLARAALGDADDTIRPAIFADEGVARCAQSLRAAGILDAAPGRDGFRFVNAFAPQMLLAMDHISNSR